MGTFTRFIQGHTRHAKVYVTDEFISDVWGDWLTHTRWSLARKLRVDIDDVVYFLVPRSEWDQFNELPKAQLIVGVV